MSFGEPEDVPGECNARLYIGDDYGDGHATMRCTLRAGHDGLHGENYNGRGAGQVFVTWERDQRAFEAAQEAAIAATQCCRCGHTWGVHTRIDQEHGATACAEGPCECHEFDWPDMDKP